MIIFFAAKDGEVLQSQQKQGDCGSDHELLIAKFRLQMKKVGKTTIPFTYNLKKKKPLPLYSGISKQIQGIRSDSRVTEELWMAVHDIVQETVIKATLKKMKCKKQNGCLRDLTKSWEKKRSKRQRRKGKTHPFECRAPKNSKER